MKIHIVQKGDTLWKIAKKYGVNFEELKKMNSQLSNPDMIMPGMKIKVPTTGGTIKKEAPTGAHKPEKTINLGTKKEMPIAEHPFAKEKPIPAPIKEMPKKEMPLKEIPKKEIPIKEVPIKEVPIKEQPILKEAPKVPYTPKMPLQVVPEIDINNYYMSNMTNMQPNLPPKPANILPEVKEVPKKEIPIPAPLPIQEAPCEDYCVPITPVMPGPGFCPPFGGGFPVSPMMPYPPVQGMAMAPPQGMPMMPPQGMIHGTPGVAPTVAGASVMPGQFYHDESSSFMPQMPVVNPAYNPGAMMGAQNPAFQQQMMDPAAYGQMPGGYGQMPAGYGEMPTGYGQMPGGYGQMPAGYGEMPAGYGQMPGGYGQMPAGYGQMPTGYDQMPGGYGQMPAGYGQMPTGYDQMPTGYGEMPAGYGQMPTGYPAARGFPAQNPAEFGQSAPDMSGTMYGTPGVGSPYGTGGSPYGYPQMGGPVPQAMGVHGFESSDLAAPAAYGQMPFMQSLPPQDLPVGTGAMGGDCGCGPAPSMGTMQPAGTAPNAIPNNFVPPTPPIYSAPYTGPVNVAQPPYMNPYGMGPVGTNPYGMPGYRDESN
ncbi:SafA/ExsA family spore coat assembly protein [Bacillus salipaludis]|uniref:SafA/ExsA family spore coat assembly protein n=1 Tax=Bacillus salipaludis TaxID=2547811 RepID=A0ABW8RF77_9BACI